MPPRPALRHGILSTDAYQLTMAQLYVRAGLHERRVRFEHFFRSYPDYGDHQAGYCVAAGLGAVRRLGDDDAGHARPTSTRCARHRSRPAAGCSTTRSATGSARVDFGGLRIDAVPEGRVVHPNTPITVVEGPLAAAQLLETPLLNQLNFATLIATKAARVVEAAHGRPVLEFGMRRAAGRRRRRRVAGGDRRRRRRRRRTAPSAYELGLTPAGTHAHSMVQLFLALGDGEQAAFDAYADVYPDDTAAARRHRRHARQRHPQRHRHVRAAAPRRPRAGRHPARLRRPRLPRRAGGRASSTGPASRTP